MSELDWINDLEEKLKPGELIPINDIEDTKWIMNCMRLIRDFKVMREIAKENCKLILPSDPPKDKVDFDFEERVKHA